MSKIQLRMYVKWMYAISLNNTILLSTSNVTAGALEIYENGVLANHGAECYYWQAVHPIKVSHGRGLREVRDSELHCFPYSTSRQDNDRQRTVD